MSCSESVCPVSKHADSLLCEINVTKAKINEKSNVFCLKWSIKKVVKSIEVHGLDLNHQLLSVLKEKSPSPL